MKYPLTSIRDSKIGFYPAQCEESVESAKRNFAMAINNRTNTVHNYSSSLSSTYSSR